MDPITITTLITSSILLTIEVIKLLKKNKHLQSECCKVDINND